MEGGVCGRFATVPNCFSYAPAGLRTELLLSQTHTWGGGRGSLATVDSLIAFSDFLPELKVSGYVSTED